MQRIKYLVNGGLTTNSIACKIIKETDIDLTVRINDELTRKILKEKILKRYRISKANT